MRPFFVYIVRCADGRLYTGHTDDLERRVSQHQEGLGAGYTALRRPVELAFAQPFPTRDEALQQERRIKRWSRAKKLALIEQDWPALHGHRRRIGLDE